MNKPIKMPVSRSTKVQILALKKTWHCDWFVLKLLLATRIFDFHYSVGRKRSYDSNSDSIPSENQS